MVVPYGMSPGDTSPCSGCRGLACRFMAASSVWGCFRPQSVPCVPNTLSFRAVLLFYCHQEVDLDNLPQRLLWHLTDVWPPGGTQCPITSQSLFEFIEAVKTKTAERRDAAGVEALLELLATCGPTTAAIKYCNLSGCPSVRACPHCGILIEYESQCKHMTCVACNTTFCFICLRLRNEHDGGRYNWSISHACPIAPLQTEIPGQG